MDPFFEFEKDFYLLNSRLLRISNSFCAATSKFNSPSRFYELRSDVIELFECRDSIRKTKTRIRDNAGMLVDEDKIFNALTAMELRIRNSQFQYTIATRNMRCPDDHDNVRIEFMQDASTELFGVMDQVRIIEDCLFKQETADFEKERRPLSEARLSDFPLPSQQ